MHKANKRSLLAMFYSLEKKIIPAFQTVKLLCRTEADWGPAKKEHQAERRALDNLPVDALESTTPLTGGPYSAISMKQVEANVDV